MLIKYYMRNRLGQVVSAPVEVDSYVEGFQVLWEAYQHEIRLPMLASIPCGPREQPELELA